MSIIENKLLSIEAILKKELAIPEYQRPYKWKEETILKLLYDIKNNKNKNEYRIGTLILHKIIESKKK
ncbi:GmrSD restriction endonuclease domain-containing protein, partial [Brachyspira pilosicoli]